MPDQPSTEVAEGLVLSVIARHPHGVTRDDLRAEYQRVDAEITAALADWTEREVDELGRYLRDHPNNPNRYNAANPYSLVAHRIAVHWRGLAEVQQGHRDALRARSHPNLRWASDHLDETDADVVLNHHRVGSIRLLDENEVPPGNTGRWLALTLHAEQVADPQWNYGSPVLGTPQEAAEAVLR